MEWRHVLSRSLRFATKILYEIMLFRVSMLDETVETRRPWRGSPRSCVLAGAFLRFVGIILTVSKLFRYAPTGEYVCATGARGARTDL